MEERREHPDRQADLDPLPDEHGDPVDERERLDRRDPLAGEPEPLAGEPGPMTGERDPRLDPEAPTGERDVPTGERDATLDRPDPLDEEVGSPDRGVVEVDRPETPPGPPEAAPAEPTPIEPAAAEPAATEPAAIEPAALEPAAAEPAVTEPAAEPAAGPVGDRWTSGAEGVLVAPDEAAGFTRRWEDVQAEFLDSPKRAVEGADRLVTELIEHVSARFAEQRASLEGRWNGGPEANTEDLRVTMQRYRDLFRRLLAG
jgi:hypothetical protein